jgi:hypothetical protein
VTVEISEQGGDKYLNIMAEGVDLLVTNSVDDMTFSVTHENARFKLATGFLCNVEVKINPEPSSPPEA